MLPQKVHHSNLNLIDGQPHANAVSWSIAKRKPFDWISHGLFFRGESVKKTTKKNVQWNIKCLILDAVGPLP